MIISEETQKKLDMLIKGKHVKKDYKKHLEKYHFKTCDEIIEYLKSGKKILYEKSDKFIIFDKNSELIDIITNDKNNCTYVEPLTLDIFRDKYFFSLLPDSNGYINGYHKDI